MPTLVLISNTYSQNIPIKRRILRIEITSYCHSLVHYVANH